MINSLHHFQQLAQQIQNPAISFDPLKTGQGGLGFLVTRIYSLALTIAGIGFFIYLLYGGLKWIVSGGDKAAVESSRSTITNAFLGLVIVIAAYAITVIIQTVLGIKIL